MENPLDRPIPRLSSTADPYTDSADTPPTHTFIKLPPSATSTPVHINSDFYDDEVEDSLETTNSEEIEGLEEHKSIILHLLSQLKLGMDLTKVYGHDRQIHCCKKIYG